MWVKLIFVIVLIGYCSCKNRTYEEVHLELTSPLPTADEKGKVMIQHSVDTFHLYGKNEMRLGKTPHYFLSADNVLDFLQPDTKNRKWKWYFYLEGQNTGLVKEASSTEAKRVSRKEIEQGIGIAQFQDTFILDEVQLIRSQIDGKRHRETYVYKNKVDESYADTVFVDFDQHTPSILFSFGATAEKERGRRIIGITYKYASLFSEEIKVQIPERTIKVRLLENPVDDDKEVLEYFELLRKLM